MALANLRGSVLEVGFGTGLNLPHYPEQIRSVTALDNEEMLPDRVQRRIQNARFPVKKRVLDASGRLPFDDEEFDGVASTFTLCSIEKTEDALLEIRRVLKQDGVFVFLEHGRSDDPKIAKRQDRFNPLQKFFACGCNLNRPVATLIENANLRIVQLDRYHMPDTPRILGEMYRGFATR